jgi:hypothetical protein
MNQQHIVIHQQLMVMTQSNVVRCGINERVYGSTEVGGWKDIRGSLVDSCNIVVLLLFFSGHSGRLVIRIE